MDKKASIVEKFAPVKEKTLVQAAIGAKEIAPEASQSLKPGSEASPEASWEAKIGAELWQELKSASDADRIKAWLWFEDIDFESIEELACKETGLSAERVAVDYDPMPDDLARALEDLSEKTDASQRALVESRLKSYLEITAGQRDKERQQTDTFVEARRRLVLAAYQRQNSAVLQELRLPEKDLVFQSQLTPSAIALLTKAQILAAAQSAKVQRIGYYEDEEPRPCLVHPYNERLDAMRGNLAKEEAGLTGAGAKILIREGWWVCPDNHYSVDIVKPEKIRNIYEQQLYAWDEQHLLPEPPEIIWHPTFVSGATQYVAPEAEIFVTRCGDLEDTEWAIIKLGIQVIGVPLHGNPQVGYAHNYWLQWYDGVAYSFGIAVVGACGNSTDDYPHVGTFCACPGGGYNTIGAGAFQTNGVDFEKDIMNNKFRYNPVVYQPEAWDERDGSGDQVCYKPDMLVASFSTSEATGLLPGIIALMIDFKPSLALKSELIKAILMASCHRKVLPALVEGGEQEKMDDGLTPRQGAGPIDVYRALSLVAKKQYGTGISSSVYQEIATIPTHPKGTSINVSLTWVNKHATSALFVDQAFPYKVFEMDLHVFNPETSAAIKSSQARNAGKQLVYYQVPETKNSDAKQQVVVTRSDSSGMFKDVPAARYAYAWSTEDTAGLRKRFPWMLDVERARFVYPPILNLAEKYKKI